MLKNIRTLITQIRSVNADFYTCLSVVMDFL